MCQTSSVVRILFQRVDNNNNNNNSNNNNDAFYLKAPFKALKDTAHNNKTVQKAIDDAK